VKTISTAVFVVAIKHGFNTKAKLSALFEAKPEFIAHLLTTLRKMKRIEFARGKWAVRS